MFNSFPQQHGIDPDLQLRSYLDCVQDQSGEAVQVACLRYRRGEVPGHDPRYLPSSAQFTAEVRKRQASIDFDARPNIEAPVNPVPDSPPVATWKLIAWRDFLAGKMGWDEFAAKIGWKQAAAE